MRTLKIASTICIHTEIVYSSFGEGFCAAKNIFYANYHNEARANSGEKSRDRRTVSSRPNRKSSFISEAQIFQMRRRSARATLDCIIFPLLSSPLGVSTRRASSSTVLSGFFRSIFFSHSRTILWYTFACFMSPECTFFNPSQNLRVCASVMLRYRCMFYADDCDEREWKSPSQSIKFVLLLRPAKRRTLNDSGNMLMKTVRSSFQGDSQG